MSLAISLLALLAASAGFGCSACHDSPAPGSPAEAATSPARIEPRSATTADAASPPLTQEDAGAELPPLTSPRPIIALPVPGFGDAVVSLPRGARVRRPILLAVHGNYDTPDYQCATWRRVVGDRGFVLCPRGIARRDSPGPNDVRYTFEGKLNAELDAALAALHERYGDWIDPGPMSYLGFSLGAILARGYVMRTPERFDRLVLIEGGAKGWNANALAKAGAARVLFACGQSACVQSARTAAKGFERAGVPNKTVFGKGAGHSYDGPVAAAIEAEWEWLTAGDSRWVP